MTNSTATTLVAKTRNQSPIVARKKMLRSVMKRASIIAKNAYNVHNTSIERIAAFGAAKSVTEFNREALLLSWAEYRAGKEIYQVEGKIPRKSMQTIHTALALKVTQTNADSTLSQEERHYEQAKTMILSRNAGKYDESEMELAYNTAYNVASDLNYSLVA